MPAVEPPLIDKPLGHDAPEIVRNRYPTSGKLEIIRTVEASHLPIRQTLRMLGSPSSTYYDWYIRWSEGGIDALAVRSPRPGSVWFLVSAITSRDGSKPSKPSGLSCSGCHRSRTHNRWAFVCAAIRSAKLAAAGPQAS